MSSGKRLRRVEEHVENRYGESAPTVWRPDFHDPRVAEATRDYLSKLAEIDDRRRGGGASPAGPCVVCGEDDDGVLLRLTDAVRVHRGCLPDGSDGSPE